MNQYRAIEVFTEVASEKSFAAAARKLSISTSAASRHVAQLEDWLGVRLFNRTTRHLSLTPDGSNSLVRFQHILQELNDLRSTGDNEDTEPQGNLRITAPLYLSSYWLVDILASYMREFPRVNIELLAADRNVNLIAEGFDIAIRAGTLSDSTMVSRKLGSTRTLVVASPAYLDERGKPSSPAELKNHDCIVDSVPAYGERWPFDQASRVRVRLGKKILHVNSGEIARDMAVAGLGITCLPDFIVNQSIKDKKLEWILQEHMNRTSGIYAIYPSRKNISGNIRSFIDYLASREAPGKN